MIEGIPAKPTTEETKEHQEDREFQRAATAATVESNKRMVILTGLIAVLTGALVGVGLLQWWVYKRQAKLMSEALTETRKSADAATISAKLADQTLKLTERAFISIGNSKLTGLVANQRPQIEIVFANAGNTPALLYECVMRVTVMAREKFPEVPDYSDMEVFLEPETPILKGAGVHRRVNAPTISQKTIDQIKAKEVTFRTWGRVRYRDVFQTSHEARFIFKYEPDDDMLVFDSLPGYNYAD